MPSWDYDEWDADRPANRYQAEIDLAVRERLYGQHETQGWRRPVDPACELHGYGTVDGLCGVCVLEREAREEAA
jgi:hypothetical protein